MSQNLSSFVWRFEEKKLELFMFCQQIDFQNKNALSNIIPCLVMGAIETFTTNLLTAVYFSWGRPPPPTWKHWGRRKEVWGRADVNHEAAAPLPLPLDGFHCHIWSQFQKGGIFSCQLVSLIWRQSLSFHSYFPHINPFLDAIASPSTYPCQSVSESFIVSD